VPANGATSVVSRGPSRPAVGISLEIAALTASSLLSLIVPGGLVYAAYLIVLELSATYLVHCPAHYLAGMALGIRFRRIRFGRTTLARVLPARAAGLARFLPVLTLSVEKGSLALVSRRRASAMYAAGTVASVLVAFMIALVSLWVEPLGFAALTWAVALGYLAFDVVFSPKSGDLMRARAVYERAPTVTSA
jgi:hypothetical protein